ncbi:dethiobiotin synthase [Acetobacteraceae bacterium KSS8]|uniref:ATP-dependent dethiobiotin synthetase BioD n=1 Tax=Endosaccharibacter trunci TaxID=2812733 RepID=A0ABT1W359_9PROT|nr:dethiobiotin synthase [Acetobacteraceae bacterium KSS8]
MLNATDAIGRRFGAAAAGYERDAVLQRLVASELAARIRRDCPCPPGRILEIGCGTGLLTRALRDAFPDALIVAADLSPAMLGACRRALPDDRNLLLVADDGQRPAFAGGFDLVCSSLALQWFADPLAACARLAALLRPGGALHVATVLRGSLGRWDAAHRAEAVESRLPVFADASGDGGLLAWDEQMVGIPYASGLAFLRGLRGIGADLGRTDRRPLGAGTLRRVLRRFEQDGAVADYRIGYGRYRRPARRGVFVTGTDTEIGKTFVSACLVRAWNAEYWKPVQTGLDSDPGDTATVRKLSRCPADRTHPPALELLAPLSPEDAAAREGATFDPAALVLPSGNGVLVVEGAGGALVPLNGTVLTTALIAGLALPVVLVARSTLGTINHTLLSLEALRARGIPVLGVILNGPPSPGNRAAIERHGRVRVLAELPWVNDPGPEAVERCAGLIPDAATLLD